MTDPNAPLDGACWNIRYALDETTLDDWLDVWQKRAQDALEAEPDTTTYAAAGVTRRRIVFALLRTLCQR